MLGTLHPVTHLFVQAGDIDRAAWSTLAAPGGVCIKAWSDHLCAKFPVFELHLYGGTQKRAHDVLLMKLDWSYLRSLVLSESGNPGNWRWETVMPMFAAARSLEIEYFPFEKASTKFVGATRQSSLVTPPRALLTQAASWLPRLQYLRVKRRVFRDDKNPKRPGRVPFTLDQLAAAFVSLKSGAEGFVVEYEDRYHKRSRRLPSWSSHAWAPA